MLYDFIKETNTISVLYYKADHPYLLALSVSYILHQQQTFTFIGESPNWLRYMPQGD